MLTVQAVPLQHSPTSEGQEEAHQATGALLDLTQRFCWFSGGDLQSWLSRWLGPCEQTRPGWPEQCLWPSHARTQWASPGLGVPFASSSVRPSADPTGLRRPCTRAWMWQTTWSSCALAFAAAVPVTLFPAVCASQHLVSGAAPGAWMGCSYATQTATGHPRPNPLVVQPASRICRKAMALDDKGWNRTGL